MQSTGLLGAQPLAHIQTFWNAFQPPRPRHPYVITSTVPSNRVPIHTFFHGHTPSIRHSTLCRIESIPTPTAQSLLGSLHTRKFHHRAGIRQDRFIWNSALNPFKSSAATKIPSPLATARVLKLEQEANAVPQNIAKQTMLWGALLDLGTPSAYQRVINRWERVLQFTPTSPLIRSDKAFELYLTALMRAGQSDALPLAATRRDQVLKQHPASAVQPEPQAEDVPTDPVPTAKELTSHSQQIAAAVMADPLLHGDSLSSATALGGGDSLKSGDRENPIHVIVEQPKGSVMWSIGKTLLVVGIYGFLTLTILSIVLENSGLMKAGSNVTEFEQQQSKPVKFSDVHGVDEAKEELRDIVEFLRDPSSFSALGGKLPKGVLLTGPPGTGKTMLARAVAGEAGVPFFFASGSEFDEIFVGVGAKRIRELFAAARKKQPAIIFIDELDAIGGKRSPKDQQYLKQTLNQLLVELDGFNQDEGIIVLAATNFPESLDKALVRPGRFDRKVPVPLPDVKGRTQILKHHMKAVSSDPEVDVTILARGTTGFSGAELQNMVNQAAIQASKEGSRTVRLKHYEWAKDKIIMGPERKSSYIEAKEKKLTAYHEGGHALVALYTQGAMPLHKVTCMPRGHALGVTTQLPEGDRNSVSYREFLAEIDVCMGGRAAEELIYGKDAVTSGASSDLQRASATARRMVKRYGYSEKLGPVVYNDDEAAMLSPQKKDEIEGEVRRLIDEGNQRVMELLKSKETELHRLASALVEYETLDLEEVKKVISGQKIRVGEDLASV